MRIFLSPHNDDEALFGSIIIQRLRPQLLVIVTDSWIQFDRGDGITWQQRRLESSEAAKLLQVPICFLGIPDKELSTDALFEAIRLFSWHDEVIAPAWQGGNPHHDIVSEVAEKHFKSPMFYATYGPGQHFTPISGNTLVPTEEEALLKSKVLNCYQSQINLGGTRPHFDAVRGANEYLSTRGFNHFA